VPPARLSYNLIAGQSVERLAALSDGIFAVAMTLLVLDLHTPNRQSIYSERDLFLALGAMGPQLITCLMSFLTLTIFWNGQQAEINRFARADRHVTWMNMAFLCAISVLPFSTRLLAEFIGYRTALLCYWGNIVVPGFVLYGIWRYACHHGLVKEDVTYDVRCAIERRILVAQALYAAGAAMCLLNTYVSIGFIVLVQLNFAIAPRIFRLNRF
jgi:uncharacterized membrane protein